MEKPPSRRDFLRETAVFGASTVGVLTDADAQEISDWQKSIQYREGRDPLTKKIMDEIDKHYHFGVGKNLIYGRRPTGIESLHNPPISFDGKTKLMRVGSLVTDCYNLMDIINKLGNRLQDKTGHSSIEFSNQAKWNFSKAEVTSLSDIAQKRKIPLVALMIFEDQAEFAKINTTPI